MKLPSATGILLSDVKPGTPAAKAGLARGDVILKVDGKVVDTSGQFRNVIAASGSKHKVHLDFVRDGKAVASDVELGEMPESDTTVAATPGAAQNGALDGIVLENLNPQNRGAFEIDDSVKQGVVIVRLDPQSNAARAGLRPGDVVLEVNRVRADNPQKFQELYSKSKSRVLLLVNRHGSTTYLVIKG
jgi:serine protease Do